MVLEYITAIATLGGLVVASSVWYRLGKIEAQIHYVPCLQTKHRGNEKCQKSSN